MFDPSNDLTTVIDGLETVTLLRRGSGTGAAGTIIAHALRRAMTAAEATIVNRGDVHKNVAGGGRHVASELTWHLPVAELPETPQLGDFLLDGDGQRWTVLEVRKTMFGARWRCATRNVAIAFGLDDTIDVLKAAYLKGDSGAVEPTWRTWRSGVRARIQPIETKIVAKSDQQETIVRYRIFVEEDLAVDHTCRIRGPDGGLYAIVGATGAQRIGELQAIEAETTR